MGMKRSGLERLFDGSNTVFLILVGFAALYPFIYILSSSVSSLDAIIRQEVYLWPKGFTLEGYKLIFGDSSVFSAYYNTIWYTAVGTLINVVLTTAAAYPLSRRNYSIRNQVMFFITFTMFFSGGMIPQYILINQLGIYNTRWVMVLPTAVAAWNLIICRVYMQTTIPEELSESAWIDGANDVVIFFKIVLPLSKPILAVLALFYGVSHWNDFFNAILYIRDSDLHPLSLYLRKILILGEESKYMDPFKDDPVTTVAISQRVKYSSIIFTMLPIMCSYPFLQKYFVKGLMIGAIKA